MRESAGRTRRTRRRGKGAALGLVLAAILMSCASSTGDTTARSASSSTTTTPSASATLSPGAVDDGCAHVVGVDVSGGPQEYTFSVTVASSETGWDKYADAWIVKGSDGTVYGERVLAHPHVNEQPFTRSLSGVAIPDGITEVVIAARDSVVGFCGDEMTVELEEAG